MLEITMDDGTNVGETVGISYQLTRKLSEAAGRGLEPEPAGCPGEALGPGWQKNDCQ